MTLNAFYLIMQTAQNLQGLRRDMRQNAAGYKQAVASSLPPQLSATILQDCDQYDRRIGWITTLLGNAGFLAALTEVGVDSAAVIQTCTDLQTAATALRTAPLATRQDIVAAANALLAGLPGQLSVF